MPQEKSLNEILLKMSKIEEKQDLFTEKLTLFSKTIQKLQANSVPQSKTSKKKQTKRSKRIRVNTQVLDWFIKYPDKVWTSDELAEKNRLFRFCCKKDTGWLGRVIKNKKQKLDGNVLSARELKTKTVILPPPLKTMKLMTNFTAKKITNRFVMMYIQNKQQFIFFLYVFLFWCVSIYFFVSTEQIRAENAGLDLFINACEHHGRNGILIFSGKAEFEVCIADTKLNNQQNEIFNCTVWFKGNDPGNGLRFLRRQQPPDKNGNDIVLLEYISRGYATGENLTVINHKSVMPLFFSVGNLKLTIPEFMKFGRIQGDEAWFTMLGLIDIKLNGEFEFNLEKKKIFKSMVEELIGNTGVKPYKIIGTEIYDSGKGTATVLEKRTIEGNLVAIYWIDILRGYICPLIHLFDADTGHLIEEYKASDFFYDNNSSLWFPLIYGEKKYHYESGELLSDWEYKVNKETFHFNMDLKDSDFSIDIPKGSTVQDARNSQNLIYSAKNNGNLSFEKNEMNLESMYWLSRETHNRVNQSDFFSETTVRLIMGISGITLVIFVIIFRLLYKK
ncbi:MAG: hypothetical protein LBE12_08320 [Planctomycetaceae bacterium]|jgi:hypothetical protein|nr:hypothetical protein [Planctomycetaceae bacterium]